MPVRSSPVTPGSALEEQARERVIVALDFPNAAQALSLLQALQAEKEIGPRWVKVGLELYLAEGAPLVCELRRLGYSIFLDLKLHDIPNTVAAAVRSLAMLDVSLLTVHAGGGRAMLAAAAEAAASTAGAGSPRLLAVTVLTSMDQAELGATGVGSTAEEQVLRLGRLAVEAGVPGLVASPLEAAMLRQACGPAAWIVTPGIRPASAAGVDDQQRVATPAAAIRAGASQLVIGRPITRAADPRAAFRAVLDEVAAAL